MVVVTAVSASLEAAQYLQQGAVITAVNRERVSSIEDFRETASGVQELLWRVHSGNKAV